MPVQSSLSPDPAAPAQPVPPVGDDPSPVAARKPAARTRRSAPRLPLRHVRVLPWIDPVVDDRGHDARSAYVERYWLPVLGPSATWFLRYLAVGFDESPEGYDLDLLEAAGALGMAGGGGATGGFRRMLDRVQSFGFAQLVNGDTLVARTHLPPLTRRQLARLPDALQAAHEHELDDGPVTPPLDLMSWPAAPGNRMVAPDLGGDAA